MEQEIETILKEFDEKFGGYLYYEELKKFIVSKLSEARKQGERTPHSTEESFCCACDYDIAVMERKIKEAQREVIGGINYGLYCDIMARPTIDGTLVRIQQSLKDKFNLE